MPSYMIGIFIEFDDAMGTYPCDFTIQALGISGPPLLKMNKGRIRTSTITQRNDHGQRAIAVGQLENSGLCNSGHAIFSFVYPHRLARCRSVNDVVGIIGKVHARTVSRCRAKLSVTKETPAVKSINHSSKVTRHVLSRKCSASLSLKQPVKQPRLACLQAVEHGVDVEHIGIGNGGQDDNGIVGQIAVEGEDD